MYCNLLGNALTIATDATVKPCCRFIPDSNVVPIKDSKAEDILHSDQWETYRKESVNEDLPGCQNCTYGEKTYNTSLRMSMNDKNHYIGSRLQNTVGSLEFLEITISNLCNLHCRTCNPIFSTTWYADQHLTNENIPFPMSAMDTYEKNKLDFIQRSDLSNLKALKLLGGETFYPKVLANMLDALEDKFRFEDVILLMYTNCTFFPSKEILEKILKFKEVHLRLSIDAYGDLNDYIRLGSTWHRVEKIADKWIDLSKNYKNLILTVATVESILNTYKIHEIKEWAEEKNIAWMPNKIFTPIHLRCDLFENGKLEDIERFISFTDILDSKYNKALKDVNLPLWEQLTKWKQIH